jgi:phosphodiesterase/alkaline phosphatase D-like protein
MGVHRAIKGHNSYEAGPLWAGPLVGEVGEHDVFIWAQGRDTSLLTLKVASQDGVTLSASRLPEVDQDHCVVFYLAGLAPDTTYQYRLSSRHGAIGPFSFKTAPGPQARRCRIAFGSCFFHYENHVMSDHPAIQEHAVDPSPVHIFEWIRACKPDLFVATGDNCYYYSGHFQTAADGAPYDDETHKLLVQLANRNNDSLRQLVRTVPTLAIWDNHDYGPGQQDHAYMGKEVSLRVFKRMWAQRSYGYRTDEPAVHEVRGTFSSVRYGPVELFLLDDRLYRDVPSPPSCVGVPAPQSAQQILGPLQLFWLKRRLEASSAPVKLVVSGTVLLPEFVNKAPAEQCWEGWRKGAKPELEELLGFIESHDIQGVVFLSGDLHLGFILHQCGRRLAGGRRGPEFYELVSSPLRNYVMCDRVLDADAPLYDRTLIREVSCHNFGMIDVDVDRAGNEIILSLNDAGGAPLARKSITLSELRVRPVRDKLIALIWPPNDKAYFFKSDRYVRYERDPQHEGVAPDYPRPIYGHWPGQGVELLDPSILPDGFDTVVVWPNGKAYFFSGNGYVAYLVDPTNEGAIAGYPKYTDLNWPGWPAHWSEGIDAGLVWNASYAYFFRGAEYIRYNIPEDRVDPGYPKPIAGNWPGLAEAFPQGVDSAIDWGNGYVYFFQGNSYVRYRKDPGQEGVEAGYPRAIAGNWPGLDRLT